MITQRFCDKHDRFHKFQKPNATPAGRGLDAYMDKFMELQARVPEMSPPDSLDIYRRGLEPKVRIHLFGAQHAGTLERALREARIFANAHSGYGARATWRVDPLRHTHGSDFPVPPPALNAESARHHSRSLSSSGRCFNCGRWVQCVLVVQRPGDLHLPCPAVGGSASGYRISRAQMRTRFGASPQCFVCEYFTHWARGCPPRSARAWRPPLGQAHAMQRQCYTREPQ